MATFTGPSPQLPGDDRFVGLARELGEQFAPRAANHDRDNTFVAENYDAIARRRLLEDRRSRGTRWWRRVRPPGLLRASRARTALQLDRTRREHASVHHAHAGLPPPRGGTGRGDRPAPRCRRGPHPDDEWRLRLVVAHRRGCRSRRRLPSDRAQAVLQSGTGRRGARDERAAEAPGRHDRGLDVRRPDGRRGRRDHRDVGHAGNARDCESGRRVPRSRSSRPSASPAGGVGTRSTDRCRSPRCTSRRPSPPCTGASRAARDEAVRVVGDENARQYADARDPVRTATGRAHGSQAAGVLVGAHWFAGSVRGGLRVRHVDGRRGDAREAQRRRRGGDGDRSRDGGRGRLRVLPHVSDRAAVPRSRAPASSIRSRRRRR